MPGPLADVALWHRMIQGRQPLPVDAAVALSAVTRPLVVTALSLVVAALLVWRWRPVLALAMVCILWWWARGDWWRVLVAGAWVLAAVVSWTRLSLGVHWFSDVLAGLALGGAVAVGSVAATKRLTLS